MGRQQGERLDNRFAEEYVRTRSPRERRRGSKGYRDNGYEESRKKNGTGPAGKSRPGCDFRRRCAFADGGLPFEGRRARV